MSVRPRKTVVTLEGPNSNLDDGFQLWLSSPGETVTFVLGLLHGLILNARNLEITSNPARNPLSRTVNFALG